jgi:hypothetical protein
LRENLEETLEGIEETNNIIVSKLKKERDHALALVKLLKSEKVEFGDGHAKGHEEFENLDKAHKALESKFSDLSKSHDLLQIRLTKELTRLPLLPIVELPMNLVEELAKLKEEISLYIETNGQLESLVTRYGLDYYPNNSSCEQATILEENVRLTKELAKLTSSKGKMSLDDLLSKQRSLNNKYGLGYVPYAKKKKYNDKKKVFPTQEQHMPEVAGVSGVFTPESPARADTPAHNLRSIRSLAKKFPAPTHNDFAGKYNPSYVLCRDYNGHVYAKYVGPNDGYIAWSIWVPKTLVTNMRGPIEKWVPKSKH